MQTFFSIIYVRLGNDFQEKISVGMIMSNRGDTIIRFSNPKLKAIKSLMSPHKYSVVKTYLKNFSQETTEINKLGQFNLNINSTNLWINEEYFSYLNRYSNNMVLFSEPRKVELEVDLVNFKNLFEKFVFYFEGDSVINKEDSIYTKVNRKLYRKIEKNVNLNVTLRSTDFKELITPVDVNFIGKNGIVVAGQTIDFDKRQYNLEHDLTSFVSFSKAVDYSRNDRGKYFVIGQEPDKKQHPKNHKTWSQVIESHLVEYVDINDSESIQEYIRSNSVTPFFEKEPEKDIK